MKCGRCEQCYYCSNNCQKADWNLHKQECQPITEATKARNRKTDIAWDSFENFLQMHYACLMPEMVEVCDRTGVSIDEMVCEIEFMANEDGVIPALQAPPIIKIAPTRNYLEGSQAEKPHFLACSQKRNPRSWKQEVESVRKCIRMMDPSNTKGLIFILNYASTFFWCSLLIAFLILLFLIRGIIFTQAAVGAFDAPFIARILKSYPICSVQMIADIALSSLSVVAYSQSFCWILSQKLYFARCYQKYRKTSITI